MKRQKIKIGDVFSLKTEDNRHIYIQLIKKPIDNLEVELVRVYYNLFDDNKSIENLNDNIKEYIYLGFPLKAALNRGVVEFLSHKLLPLDYQIPQFYRNENVFGKGWNILDGNKGKLIHFGITELSEEQVLMSPGQDVVWNDTLIIERLVVGWRHYEV